MIKASYHGEEIKAEDYNGDGSGLTCLYCNAVLDFVHSYNRGRKTVKPFFRLNRNSRHEKSCKYNREHLLKDPKRQLGTGIMNKPDDMYILHLQHPIDNHYGESKVSGSSGNLVDEVVQKGECNNNYIRKLSKVFSIYNETEKNPELRQKLKLQFNGENIAWDDFFYEAKDLKRLYNAAPIEHPIVVYGSVTFTESTFWGKYVNIWCQEDNKEINHYVIHGYFEFDDANLYNQLKNNPYCLLYFDKVNIQAPNPKGGKTYYNITGNINELYQIFIVP